MCRNEWEAALLTLNVKMSEINTWTRHDRWNTEAWDLDVKELKEAIDKLTYLRSRYYADG